MKEFTVGKQIEKIRARARVFPYCTLILIVYSGLLAGTAGLIVRFSLPDSILLVFIIPCILGSLVFLRRLYLTQQLLLAASAVWVTSQVSESFRTSLITIGVLMVSLLLLTELLHALAENYVNQSIGLRKSEKRYRELFENVPLGLYSTTPDGKITDANPALIEILGYPDLETLLSTEALELFLDPADEEKWSEMMTRHNIVRDFEIRFKRYDGTPIWVKDDTQSVFDEDGKLIAYQGSLEDISIRKEAESRIAFQSRLLDQIQDKVTATDIKGKITYVNQSAVRDLKLARDEIIGKNVSILGEDPQHGATQEEIVSTTLQEGSWRGEVVNFSSSGERVVLDSRTQLIQTEEGDPVGMLGISTDISERIKVEEELRSQKERLSSILEGTNVGTWEWNVQTGEVIFNEKWAEMIGYTLDELEPISIETWQRFAHPDDLDRSAEQLELHFQGEKDSYEFEARMHHKAGHWVWVQDRGKVIEWAEDGQPLWMYGTHTDITDKKRAEERLRNYSDLLEQRVQERTRELRKAQEKIVRQEKLAVMGELAGSVAHELRNPLGVISNAVYFLQMNNEVSSEKLAEYLILISEGTQTADKIITELLDFARARPLQRTKVELPILIKNFLEEHPPPENIRVELDFSAGIPPVHIDPIQIRQVLSNLVTNAFQAMPDGGLLKIFCTTEGNAPAEWIQITVEDNGGGIAAGDLEQIFEPLFTTKSRGIGLGLAISRKLVEANQGQITVQSEEGKWARFTISLPVVDEDQG